MSIQALLNLLSDVFEGSLALFSNNRMFLASVINRVAYCNKKRRFRLF